MAFFEAKGLRSLPQVLLNGVQLDIEEEVYTLCMNELLHVYVCVGDGGIRMIGVL